MAVVTWTARAAGLTRVLIAGTRAATAASTAWEIAQSRSRASIDRRLAVNVRAGRGMSASYLADAAEITEIAAQAHATDQFTHDALTGCGFLLSETPAASRQPGRFMRVPGRMAGTAQRTRQATMWPRKTRKSSC